MEGMKKGLPSSLLSASTLFCLCASLSSPVMAQDSFRKDPSINRTVKDRALKLFEEDVIAQQKPVSYFVGGQIQGLYDDNIYADDMNEESDMIAIVSPALGIAKNFSKGTLALAAKADLAFFQDNDDENYEDIFLIANTSYEIFNNLTVTVAGGYNMLSEDREAPNSAASAAERTEYDEIDAFFEVKYKPNRVSVAASIEYESLDFDDVRRIGGGIIDTDDRDRTEKVYALRLGYDLKPDLELFFKGQYEVTEYDQRLDSSGLARDNDGYRALVGLNGNFTKNLLGEVYVGYLEKEYDDANLEIIDGPAYGASVDWNMTKLTTISLSAEREIGETIEIDAAGIDQYSFKLDLSHELTRDWYITALTSIGNQSYEGIAREDDLLGFNLGTTYKLNRWAALNLGYSYAQRDSSINANDYEINRAFLGLGVKY